MAILVNLFFKSYALYFATLAILLWQFTKETIIIVTVESALYFAFKYLKVGFPRRMISLNLVWILCLVVWTQRQVLDLPDAYKLNAFFLFWLLGVVYLKNKLVVAGKLVAKLRGNRNGKE